MSFTLEKKSDPQVAMTYKIATAVTFVAALIYTMLFPSIDTCSGYAVSDHNM